MTLDESIESLVFAIVNNLNLRQSLHAFAAAIQREKEPSQWAPCCPKGTYGVAHVCQKQPGTKECELHKFGENVWCQHPDTELGHWKVEEKQPTPELPFEVREKIEDTFELMKAIAKDPSFTRFQVLDGTLYELARLCLSMRAK